MSPNDRSDMLTADINTTQSTGSYLSDDESRKYERYTHDFAVIEAKSITIGFQVSETRVAISATLPAIKV